MGKTILPEMVTCGGDPNHDGGKRYCGPCMGKLDANGDCMSPARVCHQSYEIRTQIRLTIAIEKLLEEIGRKAL